MKNKVFFKIILLLTIGFTGYSQDLNIKRIVVDKSIKETYKGQLSTEQLKQFRTFIQETSGITLNENSNLVINYKQPENSCTHNQYRKEECVSLDWFQKNIYNIIRFKPQTINLFYQAKKVTDNSCGIKFDMDNFIYNNFMKENQLCCGLLIINSKGNFRLKVGEYATKDVNKFLEELKIN